MPKTTKLQIMPENVLQIDLLLTLLIGLPVVI